MIESLTAQISDLGITKDEFTQWIKQIETDLTSISPEECWKKNLNKLSSGHYPFALHLGLYKFIYPNWDKIPAPAWFPRHEQIQSSHIYQLMQQLGYENYEEFYDWSHIHYQQFWQSITEILQIKFDAPAQELIDLTEGIENPIWFPEAKLNIANSCFQAKKNDIALVSQNEKGDVIKITYNELDKLSNRIANSLAKITKKNDRIAIIMPMTYTAVAIYLGIIKAGCTAVAIPDSFSCEEVNIRFRIASVQLVFSQDQIVRDQKQLPLYTKVISENSPQTIVIPASQQETTSKLRSNDILWDDFLDTNDTFETISCDPNDYINILFSSGTTGEPKAIPWTHVTPIKCGSDAYFHHNVKCGDIFCWPSNLGWMMGPWLIFACMLNKATIALFEGTPNKSEFGTFIEKQGITILGVVPTIVKTWRTSKCMENQNWQSIKLFTSTGERSNVEDMLYLMSLANYKPVIEYCGGTEIGGAYITNTLLQPSAPGAFTTAALGSQFVLLDEKGHASTKGEIALIPPAIGLSTELLNKNHHDVYFAHMPTLSNGKTLRRHGDQAEYFVNGYYKLLGRVDDTMKLGGIKISSAEIEAVVNRVEGVYESAAIACEAQGGGPSKLVIFVVLDKAIQKDSNDLKTHLQQAIKTHLNPLFKIHDVVVIDALPRTASNKVMRRVLRERF